MAQKILVVEDDRSLNKVLKYNLENEGYRVVACGDGEAGLALLRKEKPDLVILDLMLPKVDGLEFCKAAHKTVRTPILMLTARKSEVDRVLGLEMGADDYVTKPFSTRELLARVKAILRRAGPEAKAAEVLRAGAIEMDTSSYQCRIAGKPVELRAKEFEFLKLLLESAGKVLTRDELLERIWGYDRSMELDTRTVDQHIARLREKLGSEAKRIVTVKNVGYRLQTD